MERHVYVVMATSTVATTSILKCSLYGLREASKIWYELLARTLRDAGFVQLKTTQCVFCW